LEAGEPRHPWREDPSLSTRPPFEEGNTASVKHGAVSHRMLAPVAARLEEEIVELAPWCGRPAFRAAVQAWAFAEAVCLAYRAWFAERGLFDERDEQLVGGERWDRAEARAAKLRARLSLDPSALASLLTKLSSVESSGGSRAREEQAALQAEIGELEEQVVAALQRKELEGGA
jgi:hypothetical protein